MILNILHLRLKFMQYMKSSPTKSTKAHCGCASDENYLTTDSKLTQNGLQTNLVRVRQHLKTLAVQKLINNYFHHRIIG